MKRLLLLLLVACNAPASKVETLKAEYYAKTKERDSLKEVYYKLKIEQIDNPFDSALSRQTLRLDARLGNLNDSIKILRDQIDIEK